MAKFTRYKANGTPLTEHEREVLTILMEECAEVIHAASKMVRFGKGNKTTAGLSNVLTLGYEIGDLYVMIEKAQDLHLINILNVETGMIRKRRRLKKFLQTERR